jgi:hypothetical protein
MLSPIAEVGKATKVIATEVKTRDRYKNSNLEHPVESVFSWEESELAEIYH